MEELEWFESIHNRYADFCFNLGKHLLYGGSDEDVLYDVVQEVFLTLWTKRKELMNHPNIGGWLSLTVRYRMMSTMKERRRHDQQQAFSLDEENMIEVSSPQLTPEQQTRVEKVRGVEGSDYALVNLSVLKDISSEIDPLTPLADYPNLQLSAPTKEYRQLCDLLENYHEHSRAVSYGNTLMILYERNDDSN